MQFRWHALYECIHIVDFSDLNTVPASRQVWRQEWSMLCKYNTLTGCSWRQNTRENSCSCFLFDTIHNPNAKMDAFDNRCCYIGKMSCLGGGHGFFWLLFSFFLVQKWQIREGVSAAATEEPAVPGALHLPHPLQHIPASREEGLLAALLHSLDGTGIGFLPCFYCLLLRAYAFHMHAVQWQSVVIKREMEKLKYQAAKVKISERPC